MSTVVTAPVTSASPIISPAEFEQYSKAWATAVSENNNAVLAEAFKSSTGARCEWVSFTVEQVVELVSAVGAAQLRARFVLINDPEANVLRFNLVFYAADLLDRRLSAYYLGNASGSGYTQELGQEVPGGLAALWLQRWSAAEEITADKFITSYGPLEGYNFNVSDFLSVLDSMGTIGEQQVRVYLGLRPYYAAEPGDTLIETFGLAVCMTNSSATGRPGLSIPIYDMAGPVPPSSM